MKDKKVVVYEEAAERRQVEGWVCKTCGRWWAEDEHMAKWCCATDLPCGSPECSNRKKKPYIYCDECLLKRGAEREAERFEKAELIEGYEGPFFVGDRFYEDDEHYFDDIEDDELEPQEFAFVPIMVIPKVCADDIWEETLERYQVNGEYDWIPEGLDDLKAAVEKFNKRVAEDTSFRYYTEDFSKKFRLPKPEKVSQDGEGAE